jgi:3-hydroxymyristoyl/3-hydroxydecanoyl-(acyl carrier protein) dehydratase
MMEKEEIKKILPHREPLLLVDRVTELQLPDRIEAEVDIQKDWQIFQGHFPEQPILPGIYIMESMAQTADILLLLSEQNRGKLPLFFQVSQMRFYHPVYLGARLYLSAQLISDAGNGMYDCRVTAKTDAGRAAVGVITLAMKAKSE